MTHIIGNGLRGQKKVHRREASSFPQNLLSHLGMGPLRIDKSRKFDKNL